MLVCKCNIGANPTLSIQVDLLTERTNDEGGGNADADAQLDGSCSWCALDWYMVVCDRRKGDVSFVHEGGRGCQIRARSETSLWALAMAIRRGNERAREDALSARVDEWGCSVTVDVVRAADRQIVRVAERQSGRAGEAR